jgi:hypothetical protein
MTKEQVLNNLKDKISSQDMEILLMWMDQFYGWWIFQPDFEIHPFKTSLRWPYIIWYELKNITVDGVL